MSTQFGDGKRTLSTGDLVISINEIFDRLQTKVDPNTLEQLLRDILAGRRKQVRPGELITAELINQILAELESLQGRVARLEAGGVITEPTPVITDWQPKDKVQLRHRLDVTGQNFPTVPNEKSVDIAGSPVMQFLVATATKLSFEIPPTVQPGSALMTIRNGTRSASQTITVVPEKVVPKGEIFVNDVTPTLPTIEIGKLFTFVFELNSETTPSEDYTFEVKYSDPVGSATVADWKKNTQMLLATGGQVPSPLRLGLENKERLNVAITIPSGATSINMALKANSVTSPNDPFLNRSSKLIGIKVGSEQLASDPRTTFAIGTIGPVAPVRKAIIDGIEGVEVLFGASPNIPIKAMFAKAGDYEFSASIEKPDPNVWVLESSSPPGFKSSENGEQLINVKMTLKKTAPDPAGQHSEKNFLIVKAVRTNTDTIGKFTSFTRLAIQGFTKP